MALAKLVEEHERLVAAHEKHYRMQAEEVEKEVQEEMKKVEEAEQEFAQELNRMKNALANSSAASTATGSTTLLHVHPGNIVHSNDVCPAEMQAQMLREPMMRGLTPDQAAFSVQWFLTFMQTKSHVVAPPPVKQPTVQGLNAAQALARAQAQARKQSAPDPARS